MKILNKTISGKLFIMIAFLLLNFVSTVSAQTPTTLFIGDKAPSFNYGSLIKGKPDKEYKKDHLYIYEFWATWCGPCILSMPHLSEFARKNAKDVSVIAVNIWEDKSGKKGFDEIQSKVTKFTKGMGDKMDFAVVSDSRDQHMATKWMTAAGQAGIPCSFILKNGVIQWIGHPIKIDSIVGMIQSPDYDLAKKREEAMAENKKGPTKEEAASLKLMKDVETAIEKKQYKEALALIDSSVVTMKPEMTSPHYFNKFMILLEHFDEGKAMQFVREWQKTNPGYKGSVGVVICRKPGLSKATYEYGINFLKELADNPQPASLMYKEIAGGYVHMNDYKSAVEAQEIAIAKAKQYLKEGKFAGFILPETVVEYEKELAVYKSKQK